STSLGGHASARPARPTRLARLDVALRAQRVALARPPAIGVFDRHLQHVRVVRGMHLMTARARRLAALEAPGEGQRLRGVEAARPPVGPEVPLRIVVGYRLADEERQRVVFVALPRREPEEHVVLVAVAVATGVEVLARRRLARREDLQLRDGGPRRRTERI